MLALTTHQSTSLCDAGLTTADLELASRASAYLATRGYPSFRDLQVTAASGVVTVVGSVTTFHEKQVAFQSCRRVAGVHSVVDGIVVAAAPAQFVSRPPAD